jgi:hypothetical protein
MNDNEFIKALNGFEHIQMMMPLIRAVDWDGLERQSEMRCREHAGLSA